MKIVQRGKTKKNRALDAVRDWTLEIECEECDTLMLANANDFVECAVPNTLNVKCGLPECGKMIQVDRQDIETDVLLYIDFVINQEIERAKLSV